MVITNGKTMKYFARKWWNRSEKMKKNEEQLREKEKACTTSFVQNEVLSLTN